MGKSVLMSIHPYWVEHIFIIQDKIFEVRKRAPLLTPPYTVYVYCTLKPPYLEHKVPLANGEYMVDGCLNGFVVGEFTVTYNWERSAPWHNQSRGTCLTDRQLANYADGKDLVFMEIENPILYTKPKNLKDFSVKRPPQNFQFVEEIKDG